MAGKAEAVLDLGKLADRPKVRIDGKLYEMRSRDEFIYRIYRQHNRKFHRLGQLMRKRKASEAETREQSKLLDLFVRELLIAPDTLHAQLHDAHRVQIIHAFTPTLK